MIKKSDIALALLSGVLLVLGFAPLDLYLMAWIALIPLLLSLSGKRLRNCFILGMLTGVVYFGGTVYWVFNSVYFYGNVPAVLSLLVVMALCLYLGLYVGVFSILYGYLTRHSRFPALFLVPVLWVTLEFLRTYVVTGFPWSVLGYTQYKILPIIQIADITGVYGVSFLVAAVNGAIFDLAVLWPRRLDRMPLFERGPTIIGLFCLVLIIVSSLIYGVVRLKAEEKGHKIRAAVVQGNFEQEKKWDINAQREIIDTYKRLTIEASEFSPDIIVWPESALPFVFGRDERLTAEITEFQKTLGAYLLFGSVIVKGVKDDKYELSNSAVLMSPDGEVLSVYDKIHLVPFGEYVPLRKIFPFIGKLVAAIGDFRPGEEYTVMDAPPARVSAPICYEIIFPGLVRQFVLDGANVLATVTNDAWFGRSSAPYQHFSMAVFRAIENRVPVVRAANTGVSGFIDTRGRIKSRSDIFVEAVLTEELTVGSSEKTFYTRYGDLFVFFCIISCVLLIANNVNPNKEKGFPGFFRGNDRRKW